MLLVTSTHRTMLRTKLWENPSSITSCVTSRTWTRRQRIRRTDPHGAVVQDLAIPQLHRLNMILRSTMSFETSSSHIWRKLIPRSVLIKVRSLAFHGIDIYYRPAQQPHGYWQVCRHACAVFITMWPSCFEVKFKGDFQATNKILGKPHRPFLRPTSNSGLPFIVFPDVGPSLNRFTNQSSKVPPESCCLRSVKELCLRQQIAKKNTRCFQFFGLGLASAMHPSPLPKHFFFCPKGARLALSVEVWSDTHVVNLMSVQLWTGTHTGLWVEHVQNVQVVREKILLRNFTRPQHFDLATKHKPTWFCKFLLTLDSSGSGLLHPDLKVAAARYTAISRWPERT